MSEKTTASEQRGPYAGPQVTGEMSSPVRADLKKINPEIRAKVEAHLQKINGGPSTNRNRDSDHW
jgi:hypothetical protein